MSTGIISPGTTPGPVLRAGAFGHATGLVCRECGATQELGPHYACAECFGPLEISYDFPAVTREQILKQLKVDLALVCAPGATSLGRVPDKNWQITFDLLTTYLGLPKDKPVSDYYTTEFLPANAPGCS